MSPVVTAERRQSTPGLDRIELVLRAMRSDRSLQRDKALNLPNIRALGHALRALPAIDTSAAVIVIDLWYASSREPIDAHQVQYGVVHAAVTALSANVREKDLLCQLDGTTFAVLMPGLNELSADEPIRRLRAALVQLQLAHAEPPCKLMVALGAGFWQPGTPAAHPLECAWQSMLGERNTSGH